MLCHILHCQSTPLSLLLRNVTLVGKLIQVVWMALHPLLAISLPFQHQLPNIIHLLQSVTVGAPISSSHQSDFYEISGYGSSFPSQEP